jgi:hypothetical protein
MLIHIHMISGDTCTFDVPVENPMELMSRIRPAELFNRPLHQFLGKVRTVSVNPAYIEWIDVETNDYPSTAPFEKSTRIRQLSLEEFKNRVAQNQVALENSVDNDGHRNVLLAYGMATFRSGKTLCFEIQSKMERVEDRVKISQKLFNMPALFVYGEYVGVYLVNTKNIAVWQVVPGLKKSTFFALAGEMVGMQRAN